VSSPRCAPRARFPCRRRCRRRCGSSLVVLQVIFDLAGAVLRPAGQMTAGDTVGRVDSGEVDAARFDRCLDVVTLIGTQLESFIQVLVSPRPTEVHSRHEPETIWRDVLSGLPG